MGASVFDVLTEGTWEAARRQIPRTTPKKTSPVKKKVVREEEDYWKPPKGREGGGQQRGLNDVKFKEHLSNADKVIKEELAEPVERKMREYLRKEGNTDVDIDIIMRSLNSSQRMVETPGRLKRKR